MTTYTIEVNEQQMNIIEKALAQLLSEEDANRSMEVDDYEELHIMIGMLGDTKIEEETSPGTIHGWCY